MLAQMPKRAQVIRAGRKEAKIGKHQHISETSISSISSEMHFLRLKCSRFCRCVFCSFGFVTCAFSTNKSNQLSSVEALRHCQHMPPLCLSEAREGKEWLKEQVVSCICANQMLQKIKYTEGQGDTRRDYLKLYRDKT